ncbi:MAG: nitrogenase molybdenum-cofactor synthesis protein NifE [Psychromonas sp.]|jgi:nitrogenase molybdenum-cofactor synthesis protein NifE|uniref:nitrogenase iron-molybdenum cofactor biosynthesis protein NifE n=1 Tax=Psychromonas sp. TaxID=1884585 RepID=UPI0039E36D93
MRQSEITELQNEPACSHNKKSKSGCAPATPGATAGGCCFDGAQITLLPIADVAHIVHGPIGCAGSSWDKRGTQSSGPELFRLGFSTDLNEQDVIMGRGEKRLYHAILQVAEKHQPAAVFIYNTCVPAMEGDDIESVCRSAQKKINMPVIAIDAAGFYGNKNLGNRIAGELMVDKVIGTATPAPKPEFAGGIVHDIALVGEYNIAGELWHILPLLDQLGLRVLANLSGDCRFKELQTMHHAQALMLVCSRAQINVARKLEDKYQIPWFEGSFYGIRDICDALRQFAKLIDDPSLTTRTEQLINAELSKLNEALTPYIERLKGKKALLYTGGVKSWSIVSALQDLGMEVVASGTRKSTEEDKARIRELMGDNAILLDETSPRNLLDVAYQYKADVMIAGGRNMYTAYKARMPFVEVNQEREHAFAGFKGMLTLAQQLCLTIESPVWQQVRQPAPWS